MLSIGNIALTSCGGEYNNYKVFGRDWLKLDKEIKPLSVQLDVKDTSHCYIDDDYFSLTYTEEGPIDVIWNLVFNTLYDPHNTNTDLEDCEDFINFRITFESSILEFTTYSYYYTKNYIVYNDNCNKINPQCRWPIIFDWLHSKEYITRLNI